jgi:hypothetical protein
MTSPAMMKTRMRIGSPRGGVYLDPPDAGS